MEPLERLLNLVGLLLETPTPLTFEQIRDTLDAYRADNVDSAKRMFERDKDQLREFGIPLQLVDTDVWGTEQGYIIPKDEYYLPEIAFTPEELGALLVAAQSGGENTRAEQAARKLLVRRRRRRAGRSRRRPAGVGLRRSQRARDRLRRRRAAPAAGTVRVSNVARAGRRAARSTRTRWSSGADTGTWSATTSIVTTCEPSGCRGSRATSTTPARAGSRPRASGLPTTCRPAPWAAAAEDHAEIAFSPEVAWWAVGSFAGARRDRVDDDGWVVVDVPMADPGPLASLVLQFGPEAVVRAPEELRDEIVRRLEAVDA